MYSSIAPCTSGEENSSSPATHRSYSSGPIVRSRMSSIQSVATQPVASPDSIPMHHGALTMSSAAMASVSAINSSQVSGISYPPASNVCGLYQTSDFRLSRIGTPYNSSSKVTRSSNPPTVSSSRVPTSSTSSREVTTPWFQKSSSSPGCGCRMTSGALPAPTRVRANESNSLEPSSRTSMSGYSSLNASMMAVRPATSSSPVNACSTVTSPLSAVSAPSSSPVPQAVATMASAAPAATSRHARFLVFFTINSLSVWSSWPGTQALTRVPAARFRAGGLC